MKRLRTLISSLAVVTILPLAGCFWSVGGGTQKSVVEPTPGEELTDLKRALEAGAITPDDYEKLKKVYLGK